MGYIDEYYFEILVYQDLTASLRDFEFIEKQVCGM